MIEEESRGPFWASDVARKVTIGLLVLQLAGCGVDLTTSQTSLISIVCLATVPDNPALERVGLLIWLTLSLSWIVGFVAVWREAIRPIYWLLLIAVPIGFTSQQVLLENKTLHCDGP